MKPSPGSGHSAHGPVLTASQGRTKPTILESCQQQLNLKLMLSQARELDPLCSESIIHQEEREEWIQSWF